MVSWENTVTFWGVNVGGVWIDTLHTPLGTTSNYSFIANLHTLQFTVTHTLGFLVFTSLILATDFDTVIIPVSLYLQHTRSLFFQSKISFLSSSSTAISRDSFNSFSAKSESKLCYDRRSVGQSAWEQSTHLELKTRSLLLCDSFMLVDVGLSLSEVSQSAVVSLLSVGTIYILHIIKCMYIQYTYIYKASVTPESVQQIMPHH
jgi:hypothetical protein